MNNHSSLWRYGVLILLVLLLSSDSTIAVNSNSATVEEIAIASDNPIMIIRCRNIDFLTSGDKKNDSKVVDTCPFGYEFVEGECLPDCSQLETAPPGYFYRYNPESGDCECRAIPTFTTKGSESKDVETESCDNFTFDPCFDGIPAIEIPFVDCGSEPGQMGKIEICFVSSDPSNPLLPGQQIPFSDIQNCFGDAGEDLVGLAGTLIGDGDAYAFDEEVGADGKLCVTVYFDPTQPIVFDNENLVDPIQIITPCASDPCSCENENNIRENGAVTLFADVLSLSNLPPGVAVGALNLIPSGFRDEDGLVYQSVSLGNASMDGTLDFPFYRGSNEVVNIQYQYPDATNFNVPIVTIYENGMTCDAADCPVIPTMGQWSLLILAMLLSSLGLIFLGKRRFA